MNNLYIFFFFFFHLSLCPWLSHNGELLTCIIQYANEAQIKVRNKFVVIRTLTMKIISMCQGNFRNFNSSGIVQCLCNGLRLIHTKQLRYVDGQKWVCNPFCPPQCPSKRSKVPPVNGDGGVWCEQTFSHLAIHVRFKITFFSIWVYLSLCNKKLIFSHCVGESLATA